MENLRYSATNGGEGTYDVLYLPTGYEPNGHNFNELQNSSVPLSFKIPAADQDVDDQEAQKEDRFLRGRQIAYLIYEYFRVTGANDSVENYADLFTIVLRNGDIQEFDSKWDGILLSMTKIPH